jgi:hypothetical protein
MKNTLNFTNPSYTEVGCIGFIIYFPFCLFLAYRLYLSFKEDLNPFKKKNRMFFHLAMFSYAILETICIIILWSSSTNIFVAVCFHFFAMFSNIVGFSIVYYCISKLIFRLESNEQNTVFWVISIFLSIIFLLDIAALFALNIKGINGDCGMSQVCNNAVMVRDVVEGLSLFLLSLNFSITGYRITRRIFMTQQGFNWDAYLNSNSEMLKINVITVSCTLFYLLRVFFISMIIDYESSPEGMHRVEVFFGVVMTNELYWFILSKWITFIFPTLMLLHLMRPKNLPNKKGASYREEPSKINIVVETATSKLHESTQQVDNPSNNYVVGEGRSLSSEVNSSKDSTIVSEDLQAEMEYIDEDSDVLREMDSNHSVRAISSTISGNKY